MMAIKLYIQTEKKSYHRKPKKKENNWINV